MGRLHAHPCSLLLFPPRSVLLAVDLLLVPLVPLALPPNGRRRHRAMVARESRAGVTKCQLGPPIRAPLVPAPIPVPWLVRRRSCAQKWKTQRNQPNQDDKTEWSMGHGLCPSPSPPASWPAPWIDYFMGRLPQPTRGVSSSLLRLLVCSSVVPIILHASSVAIPFCLVLDYVSSCPCVISYPTCRPAIFPLFLLSPRPYS